MSKEKAAALAALSEVDMAVYKAKRNQRQTWHALPHDEWAAFCTKMADWFKKDATDEWDKFVEANNARKAASDEAALLRVVKMRTRRA